MVSFLQSSHWKHFQEALGRTTHTDSGANWSYLAIKESGTLNSRIYTPYGPDCYDLDAFDQALTALKSLAKTERTTFIRVEPTSGISANQLRVRGFRPVTYQQLQPAHTQLIDLSQPTDDILANMSQNSRNITRNYHKKGLTIRTSHQVEDITILTSLLAGVASRNQITTHNEAYFRAQAKVLFPTKAATLYLAEFEGTPIAAALVYDSADTRTYAHAAADSEHRKLNAGTALVGQLILDAKEAGLSQVDLYGITESDDPNHPWTGFTRFKKSFGGESVAYPGAWDLPLQPTRYWIYRAYQLVHQFFRRRGR